MADLTPEQLRRRTLDLAEVERQKAQTALAKDKSTSRNVAERAQSEHEASLIKARGTIQAYNRDALGSYKAAEKRAYDNALPTNGLSLRQDYQFIQKVRGIAQAAFDNDRKTQRDAMMAQYNLEKPATGPIGSFIDMPVRITDALGRDIGTKLGAVRNAISAGVSGAIGKDGTLFSGPQGNSLDKADKFLTAVQDDITRIVTESPWIEKKIKALKDKANKPLSMEQVNSFFSGMNNVFASQFRRMCGDLGDILNEWWHDPRTLCCLIKTLAALAMATAKKIGNETGIYKPDASSFGATYNKIVKKYFHGDMKFTELTDTRDFFDKMISILKIIRDFLNQDLNFNFALNLDLGLSMSKASIGALMALLTALQQMLEDKIYSKMMEFVRKKVPGEVRQCLPFEKLLRLLADWMTGPDGIFKYIEQFVDAYMIGFANNVQYGFDQSAKTKMMDVAALDKLIKLMEKLRDAMLNMELCMEADFSETPQPGDDGGITTSEKSVGIGPTNYGDMVDAIRGNQRLNNSTVYPTDTEIKAFLTNRLGESTEFANQVLASAKSAMNPVGQETGSPDNAGGAAANLRMTIGDCARTLSNNRIEELAKLMADWEII